MCMQIQQYRMAMRKYRPKRNNYGVKQYNKARDEFVKLLEKREVYWKQRSKQFWLREGDQNTKFFHKFALGRRKQNQVKRLKDANGEWKEDKDGVRQIIQDYFSELFQSSMTDVNLSDREDVHQITREQNQRLTKCRLRVRKLNVLLLRCTRINHRGLMG